MLQRRLRLDFYVIDRTTRLGNRFANLTHYSEVSDQGVLKVPASLCLGVPDGRTSWYVRRESGEAGARRFDHDWVTPKAHFGSAFFSVALSMPGASSFPSLPGTVIRRGCSGCLKCLWLPFERISFQPCFSISGVIPELSPRLETARRPPVVPANIGQR
jgi:hypothetical protein